MRNERPGHARLARFTVHHAEVGRASSKIALGVALVLFGWLLGVLLTGRAATFPAFDADCDLTHSNQDDPIVFPGVQGASHMHDFYGNDSTDAFSNYASMVAAGTGCQIADDTAGYWQPRLIIDGVYRVPKFGSAKFWYAQPEKCAKFKCMPNPGVMEVDHTFPADLRIVIGKSTATSEATNPLIVSENIMWNCYPASGNVFGGLPNECEDILEGSPGGRLDLWVKFPACWNGTDLDSADHFSHMAYPTSAGCPASHPVVLPQLKVQVSYAPFNGSTLAEPTSGYSSGRYWTVHFDFWNTWQQEGLVALTGGVDAPEPTPSPSPACTLRPRFCLKG